jgi:hypothetical protein
VEVAVIWLLSITVGLLVPAAMAEYLTEFALGHCPLYQKLGYTPRSLKVAR